MSMVIVGGISTTAADDAGRTIYFDISNKTDWQGFKAYYAYIWGPNGDYKAWNGIKMTPVDSTKATEAKLFSVEVPEGDWDLIIFNANAGPQTYDTTFSEACFGDTAYVLDEVLENPVDSTKTAIAAGWRNSTKDGPHVSITSTGKVQGNGILARETPEGIADAFITSYAANMAEGLAGYDNPALITDEARANYIAEIIAKTGYDPNPTESSEDTQPTDPQPTDPQPTDPQPTEPAPTEPAPTEPAPTEPAPTEPAPTEPAPTEAPTNATVADDPYGRIHGQPMLDTMNLPAKDTNRDAYIAGGAPETWDGYFNIYYFAAPAEWEGSPEKKAEGIENIGFYWYCGTLNNQVWPGESAQKLVDADGNQITYTVTDSDSPYVGQELNVYYAFAPSFATHIIWNNGISDGEFKAEKLQTEDIKVDDPGLNNLADANYDESDGAIEAVSVAGCINYIYSQTEVVNPLTQETQTVNECNFLFYNPRTGESTDKALQVDGEFVLCSENDTDWKLYQLWAEDYSAFGMNPYYDMNYDFINEKGEVPTQPEPVTLPPDPADVTDPASNGGANGNNGNGNNGNGNGSSSNNNTTTGKVVNTADSAVAVILLTVLVGAIGAVFMARKRREDI